MINNKMCKINYKFLILICSFSVLGCLSKEEKKSREVKTAYNEILSIIKGSGKVVERGHLSGNISGNAIISLETDGLSVAYSALNNSHKAYGELSSFDIDNDCGYENCEDYISYSLTARWNPVNDASGKLNITVSKNNVVEIYIFGDGNWTHWEKREMQNDSTIQNILNKTYHTIYGDIQEERTKTVLIGNKEWMNYNLNVDKFRNGDPIPRAETDEEWLEATKNKQPAWCYLDNDPLNGEKFGKLYNWYAVNDPRGLAPPGWKIPSDEDWTDLINFVSGSYAHHYEERFAMDRNWPFSGDRYDGMGLLGQGLGGMRKIGFYGDSVQFINGGNVVYFWTSTEHDVDTALIYNFSYSEYFMGSEFEVDYEMGELRRFPINKHHGSNVRCVSEATVYQVNGIRVKVS